MRPLGSTRRSRSVPAGTRTSRSGVRPSGRPAAKTRAPEGSVRRVSRPVAEGADIEGAGSDIIEGAGSDIDRAGSDIERAGWDIEAWARRGVRRGFRRLLHREAGDGRDGVSAAGSSTGSSTVSPARIVAVSRTCPKPAFETSTAWLPGARSPNVAGVRPRRPSTRTAAPSGVEVTINEPVVGGATRGVGSAAGGAAFGADRGGASETGDGVSGALGAATTTGGGPVVELRKPSQMPIAATRITRAPTDAAKGSMGQRPRTPPVVASAIRRSYVSGSAGRTWAARGAPGNFGVVRASSMASRFVESSSHDNDVKADAGTGATEACPLSTSTRASGSIRSVGPSSVL